MTNAAHAHHASRLIMLDFLSTCCLDADLAMFAQDEASDAGAEDVAKLDRQTAEVRRPSCIPPLHSGEYSRITLLFSPSRHGAPLLPPLPLLLLQCFSCPQRSLRAGMISLPFNLT
jgi:hypothetical protein